MTLDEAIKRCEEKGNSYNEHWKEHLQLTEWLQELKNFKEKRTQAMTKDLVEVVRCKECKYLTNNINDSRFCNGYCRRKEAGCFYKVKDDGTDYCSYGVLK